MRLRRRCALLGAAVLLLMLAAGCHEERPTDLSGAEEAEVPDQEGWNSRVSATKNGRPEAIINYGHMMRYLNRKKVLFDQGVAVDFYDIHGRKRTQLTSDAGELSETTNDIMANGNVVVVSDTGVTVYTEQLGYRQSSGKIYSQVEVMIISAKGDTLYGTGFESDTALRDWQIKNLAGTSHTRLDLSGERFKKRPLADSTAAGKVASPAATGAQSAPAGVEGMPPREAAAALPAQPGRGDTTAVKSAGAP